MIACTLELDRNGECFFQPIPHTFVPDSLCIALALVKRPDGLLDLFRMIVADGTS